MSRILNWFAFNERTFKRHLVVKKIQLPLALTGRCEQGRLRLNATLGPIQNGQLKAIKLKFRIETKKLLTLTNNFITPPPNLTYLSYYFPIWLISLIIFRKLNCYGWIVSHTMLPSFQPLNWHFVIDILSNILQIL